MPQARGTQTTSVLVEEATYKTTPGVPSGQKMYLTANNVTSQQNLIDSNTLQSDRERGEPIQGNINVSGSLEFELAAEWCGTLLKHVHGTNVTSGVDPYTHTMELGDLPVGFIVEKDFGSNISGSGRYVYDNGCRVASATFNFPQEGFPTASVNVTGALETADSTPLDASPDDEGATSFSAFDATILEGGGAISTVTSCSFTIDNGLDDGVYVIGGSGQRAALPEGFATVTGTLTSLFDSYTLINKAINSTETAIKITLSRGDGLGSAGNESMDFHLQQLKYELTSQPIDGPQGLVTQLSFKGYKSGSTSAVETIIKNAVATI